MSTEPSRALLVFARNPVAGQVKTRLIPALGPQGAADLYRELLENTLHAATQIAEAQTEIWLADGQPTPPTQSLLDRYDLPWHAQSGRDLGERMQHAIECALRTSQSVVLIGSDCAEFTPDYLNAAFTALDEYPVVIGPAADGGYLLIGVREPCHALFEDVPWGHSEVLPTTRRRLMKQSLRWHELPTRHDIDVAADLEHIPQILARIGAPDPASTGRRG